MQFTVFKNFKFFKFFKWTNLYNIGMVKKKFKFFQTTDPYFENTPKDFRFLDYYRHRQKQANSTFSFSEEGLALSGVVGGYWFG